MFEEKIRRKRVPGVAGVDQAGIMHGDQVAAQQILAQPGRSVAG
jgi:hypothetical protein